MPCAGGCWVPEDGMLGPHSLLMVIDKLGRSGDASTAVTESPDSVDCWSCTTFNALVSVSNGFACGVSCVSDPPAVCAVVRLSAGAGSCPAAAATAAANSVPSPASLYSFLLDGCKQQQPVAQPNISRCLRPSTYSM
jgi:hypothetical protein